jgi:hypothetical protein
MFTPNVVCIGVCLYSWLSTTFGIASRLSSITSRMPLRSDSSRRSVMSGTFFSWTRSAIFWISPPSPPFFTAKGSSVTMIASLPWPIGSICARACTRTRPRPVS